MLKELVLRRAEHRDGQAVRAILDKAFPTRPETGRSAESLLVDQLRADGDVIEALSIVADRGGEVVGTVTCSRGSVGDLPAVGLGPIAVPPPLQRRGIGAALMSSVIVTADQRGEVAIIVLGDPAYYEEFYFEPAAAQAISSDIYGSNQGFMVRTLAAWRPEMAGPFKYANAFESV